MNGIPIIPGDPRHCWAAEINTVMVSPYALLIALDQHPVRAGTAGLDPAVSLQCR
jgi:hypothetical protein